MNEAGNRPHGGRGPDQSSALFLVLLAQIPLVLLFLLPGTSALGAHMMLWMFFLVSLTLTMWMVAPSEEKQSVQNGDPPQCGAHDGTGGCGVAAFGADAER